MAKIKLTPDTPLRMQPMICAAFVKQYRAQIEEHGATFALNFALRDLLCKCGHKIAEIETPLQRIAKAQKRRWQNIRRAQKTMNAQVVTHKQRRAAIDKARRLKAKEIKPKAGDE